MRNPKNYLEKVERLNPRLFSAEKIQLAPESLRAVIRNAWLDGYDSDKRSEDLFDKLFGALKK